MIIIRDKIIVELHACTSKFLDLFFCPHILHCSIQKAINDVCWSPMSSTMFACATDGKVEIWDLDTSV